MSFFEKVNFSDLSEVDRSIYHYLSKNSDKVSYMRVREIAEESHTSASSVMRFIRKLGYGSFAEFKTFFKTEQTIEHSVNDFILGTKILNRENFAKDIEAKLSLVADEILNAENIIFFGIGSSGSMCDYAARKLANIGYNSFALTDPTYPIFSKLRNTANNVLIALSVSGTTTEILEIVSDFKVNADFVIISITADEYSTLAKLSKYTLAYKTDIYRLNQYGDMSSQLPCLHIIESLVRAVQKSSIN